jgi:hypothetical protein
MKQHHGVFVLGGFLALAGTSSAGVIVVDAAGGGSFTQIQPAIDAAVDGDTILVKPGHYTAFSIVGKGLTVVGDVGTITMSGRVEVEDTLASQIVTLANLKSTGAGSEPQGMTATFNAAAVRVVACEWVGANDGPTVPVIGGGVGASFASSTNVAVSGCTIVGGDGESSDSCLSDLVSPGGVGLVTQIASVAMYDTVVRGGHGGNGGNWTEPGGIGIQTLNGFLFASRSNITGGHGGNSACADACADDGGPGWRVHPIANAWMLDCMVSGGLGGANTGPNPFECPRGQPGANFPMSTPFTFAVPNIGFTIPHIAREGTFVQVKFIGPPGARVFLNDELTTTFESVPSWRGVLLSPFPSRGSGPERERRWGIIPASGELNQLYKVPMLPSGEQAQTRFLQAYRVGANGITLGTFRTLTVLDSAF